MASIKNYINLQTNIPAIANQASNALQKMANTTRGVSASMRAMATSANTAQSAMSGWMQSLVGNFAANALMNVIAQVTGAISNLNHVANEYNSIQARLKMIGGSQENAIALNNMIYKSAQRARGGYLDMAEAVSHLAMSAHDAFPDPSEAVDFMEGIQKLFVIGGSTKEAQKSAMLQLTQGMASGQLQGDEFRSIAENAPIIENMIAKTMGVSRGELKKLSSQGKITAEVIKQSIMENMDEINAQFATMPKTFGDHMQDLSNRATSAFLPVFERMKELGNSDVMADMVDGISTAIEYIAPFFYGLVGVVQSAMTMIVDAGRIAGNFLKEHFGIVKIAFLILAGIMTYYGVTALIAAGHTLTAMAAVVAKTVADWAATGATVAATLAQHGLNAALYACPLSWIIALIFAVIAVFYLAIEAVNYFAGTSISATGIMFGTFAWLFGFLKNSVAFIWNRFAAFANFFANVFKDPVNATYNLFADLWNGILDLAAATFPKLLEWMKKIPGLDKVIGDTTFESMRVERREIAGGETTLLGNMDMTNLSDAFDSGNKMGEDLEKTISGTFAMPKMPDINFKPTNTGHEPPKIADSMAKDSPSGKETAKNTRVMANAIEMTNDEIKELRQSAVQRALQEFNKSHVIVNVDMDNNISSDVDIDGFTDNFLNGLRSAISQKREGVAL